MTKEQREYVNQLKKNNRKFECWAKIEKQDEDSNEFKFILSTEMNDRHGEKVKIAGVDLAEFKKNPVMLLRHDDKQSVGIWENIKKEDGKITAIAKFDLNDETGLSQRIHRLAKDNMIKAVSIGFISKIIEFEDVAEEDIRE